MSQVAVVASIRMPRPVEMVWGLPLSRSWSAVQPVLEALVHAVWLGAKDGRRRCLPHMFSM